MKQPEKWKDTVDPFSIPFKAFNLVNILGYPHARNDVFYCKGIYNKQTINCFIKYSG